MSTEVSQDLQPALEGANIWSTRPFSNHITEPTMNMELPSKECNAQEVDVSSWIKVGREGGFGKGE